MGRGRKEERRKKKDGRGGRSGRIIARSAKAVFHTKCIFAFRRLYKARKNVWNNYNSGIIEPM